MGLAAVAVEPGDWGTLSAEEGRSVLRQWREEGCRRSEEVVELWEHVISRHPHSLGDELWPVLEQVAVAALDAARMDVAEATLSQLSQRFPGSLRVRKLQGMRLEALERWDDALDVYDSLIQAEPTNPSFRKRRVAVFKGRNLPMEALKELSEYLKTFINDTEAWTEAMHLYLQVGDLRSAAHCAEELILAAPHNHLYHQRYAEVKYSQGGSEPLETAVKHFSHAVSLCPSSGGSLYGLLLSATTLARSNATSANRRKDLIALGVKTADQLLSLYEKEGQANPIAPIHQRAIQNFKKGLESAQPST